jgi:hypothetical protein
MNDAGADGVFGFLGIVPEQAGQQVRCEQQRKQHGRERHRDATGRGVHALTLYRPPNKKGSLSCLFRRMR